MKLLDLFRRKPVTSDISAAARAMALEGVSRDRAKVRARVDLMRAQMGLEPVRWPS